MVKAKILGAIVFLLGSILLARSYYLVTFSVGYGIKDADRNQQLFLRGAIGCGVLFLIFLFSLLIGTKKNS